MVVPTIAPPQLNPGLCHNCGYQNEPRFGQIICAQCGEIVTADPMSRKIATYCRREWLKILAGGVLLGVVLLLLGALFGGGGG